MSVVDTPSSAGAFVIGVKSAAKSVFIYVMFGTFIGYGALCHDLGFSLTWALVSTVLIWAADPAGREAGACSGDSGAPIWSADGSTAIAIVAWAQAPHGRGCGGLTQGPLLAPLKGWIEATERRLGTPQ